MPSQVECTGDYDCGCDDCAPRKTRAQKAIHAAAEARGWRIGLMEWEPVGGMVEMSGREGGWSVFGYRLSDDQDGHALGYSYQEIVEWIGEWWEDGA